MNTILNFLFGSALLLLISGLVSDLLKFDQVWVDRLYGGGTVALFFIWMPLFLISRRNKTSLRKTFGSKNTKKENNNE